MKPALLLVLTALVSAAQQGADSGWRLATEDTELAIGIMDGQPALKTLKVRGSQRNWLSKPVREPLMPEVVLDGSPVKTGWKFQGGALDAAGEQLTLRFENGNPRLALESIWRARPGHGPAEHWLTIANQAGRTVTITHQDSLVLDALTLAAGEKAQVWWINRGGSNATRQGGTFVVDADAEFDQTLVSDPMDGSSPVPWMAVQVGKARGLYVGWEFSGIGRVRGRTAAPSILDLRVGNPPDFKTDLAPDEVFLVPAAFVGCYNGDIDDGAYTLHRFVLEKLLPPLPKM